MDFLNLNDNIVIKNANQDFDFKVVAILPENRYALVGQERIIVGEVTKLGSINISLAVHLMKMNPDWDVCDYEVKTQHQE